jgi:hypothetical protein
MHWAEGTLQDYVRAHMWANIAASKGLKTAFEFRKLLALTMTPVQIEKAQFIARECTKKNLRNC